MRSPSVFADYYKQHDKFEEDHRDGFQTVGDIAYRDDEGFLYICDRKKDMIISGGMNIYPAEIEAALETHPDVYEAAVFGIPSEEWGESVHAVVVKRARQPTSTRPSLIAARPRAPRRLQGAALDLVDGRAAQDRLGQDPQARAAGARTGPDRDRPTCLIARMQPSGRRALGIRDAGRPAQRRQVVARQHDLRREGVSIVSDKPQTTRHRVRGVLDPPRRPARVRRHAGAAQAGHRARPQGQRHGDRERRRVRRRRRRGLPRARRHRAVRRRRPVGGRPPRPAAAPSSSSTRSTWPAATQVARPARRGRRARTPRRTSRCRRGPATGSTRSSSTSSPGCRRARRTSPTTTVRDVPDEQWVAELVREQLLAVTRDELPYSIATRVAEWEGDRITVEIVVERESQKGMVIGKGGQVLKQVGERARRQLPEGTLPRRCGSRSTRTGSAGPTASSGSATDRCRRRQRGRRTVGRCRRSTVATASSSWWSTVAVDRARAATRSPGGTTGSPGSLCTSSRSGHAQRLTVEGEAAPGRCPVGWSRVSTIWAIAAPLVGAVDVARTARRRGRRWRRRCPTRRRELTRSAGQQRAQADADIGGGGTGRRAAAVTTRDGDGSRARSTGTRLRAGCRRRSRARPARWRSSSSCASGRRRRPAPVAGTRRGRRGRRGRRRGRRLVEPEQVGAVDLLELAVAADPHARGDEQRARAARRRRRAGSSVRS